MMLGKHRLLGTLAVATLFVAFGTGCGGPESASAADGSSDKASSKKSEKRRTDAPPADWVRARCKTCSCRMFSGEEPYCKRPSCKHHWTEHKSSLGG